MIILSDCDNDRLGSLFKEKVSLYLPQTSSAYRVVSDTNSVLEIHFPVLRVVENATDKVMDLKDILVRVHFSRAEDGFKLTEVRIFRATWAALDFLMGVIHPNAPQDHAWKRKNEPTFIRMCVGTHPAVGHNAFLRTDIDVAFLMVSLTTYLQTSGNGYWTMGLTLPDDLMKASMSFYKFLVESSIVSTLRATTLSQLLDFNQYDLVMQAYYWLMLTEKYKGISDTHNNLMDYVTSELPIYDFNFAGRTFSHRIEGLSSIENLVKQYNDKLQKKNGSSTLPLLVGDDFFKKPEVESLLLTAFTQ